MTYRTLLIIMTCALTGCQTTSQDLGAPQARQTTSVSGNSQRFTTNNLMHSYLHDIVKDDGINQREAIILAQSELVFRGRDHNYVIAKPRTTLKKQYWLVTFDPKNKTLSEISRYKPVLIGINSINGEVLWKPQNL